MRRLISSLIPLVVTLAPASAQSPNVRIEAEGRARIQAYLQNRSQPFAIDILVDIGFVARQLEPLRQMELVAELRNGALARSQAGSDYQHRRLDKMAGAPAGGAASTNAVSKTGVADLFSAALENGALTRTQEGTATTFRINAYGVSTLFHGSRTDCSISNPLCDSKSELFLRGLSATLTIDNSTGQAVVPASTTSNSGTTVPLGITRQGGRIASAGAHFDVLRRARRLDPKQYDVFKTQVGTAQAEANNYSQALAATGSNNAEFKTFSTCVQNGFEVTLKNSTAAAEFERAYEVCLAQLYKALSGSSVLAKLSSARTEYYQAMSKALHDLLFKPQLSVEYTHDRPIDQPSLSTIRLIYDFKFLGRDSRGQGNVDDPQGALTFNFGATIYETIPQGVRAGKFRSAQAALQFDRKIGKLEWQNRPVVSLAGYYQYQKESSILQFGNDAQTPILPIPLPKPAVELLNTKGGIGIVQGKVTIPITDVLNVPIAVSWSNRTELLKASEVRGQFGISVDLDKLFGKANK